MATIFDNSPTQLSQYQMVVGRERIEITTAEGDIRDLHISPDNNFDYFVQPVSDCFVPGIQLIWQ